MTWRIVDDDVERLHVERNPTMACSGSHLYKFYRSFNESGMWLKKRWIEQWVYVGPIYQSLSTQFYPGLPPNFNTESRTNEGCRALMPVCHACPKSSPPFHWFASIHSSEGPVIRELNSK
jgi:hypothetical protein